MIRWNSCLFLVFFLLAGFTLMAQVNDAQLWMSVNLEKKLTPAFSILFTQEARLNENMTEVGTIFSEPGVSYRFSRRFKAGMAYRFTLKRRLDDTYERRHSWYIQGLYRESLKPVQLVFRIRYQSRYDDAFTSVEAAIPENHFRTKLTLKYDLNKKFEPYVYGETFFQTCSTVTQSFDQLRLCAGIEYSFNRKHMIDLHYLISREYNVKNPETDYVVGVGYYFVF
jgi:hypothetical protein